MLVELSRDELELLDWAMLGLTGYHKQDPPRGMADAADQLASRIAQLSYEVDQAEEQERV